jgi:hypothetical protein
VTTTLYANAQLVAIAVLKEILGGANNVGATLPEADDSGAFSWQTSGFVQVTGNPILGWRDQDSDVRHNIIPVDFWAVAKPGSNNPPWGMLNNLIETVWNGFFKWTPHQVTLQGQFPKAIVHTLSSNTEPRRVPD